MFVGRYYQLNCPVGEQFQAIGIKHKYYFESNTQISKKHIMFEKQL